MRMRWTCVSCGRTSEGEDGRVCVRMRPTGGTPAGLPSSSRCRLSTVRTLRRLGPATTGRVLGGRSRSAVGMTVQRTAILSPVVPGCSWRTQAFDMGVSDLSIFEHCIPCDAIAAMSMTAEHTRQTGSSRTGRNVPHCHARCSPVQCQLVCRDQAACPAGAVARQGWPLEYSSGRLAKAGPPAPRGRCRLRPQPAASGQWPAGQVALEPPLLCCLLICP